MSRLLTSKKLNDIRFINKFFESIYSILSKSGFYIGKLKTYPNRRKALLDNYPLLFYKIYFCMYF